MTEYISTTSKKHFLLNKRIEELVVKKGVLKNFANFTGEHLCWFLSLINLQSESFAKFAKFLRTRFEKHLRTVASDFAMKSW